MRGCCLYHAEQGNCKINMWNLENGNVLCHFVANIRYVYVCTIVICIRVSLYFILLEYVRWGVTACRNMSSRTHAETLNFYFNSMSEPQIQNY